uniref:(California timema) hypothetical protein n=1 Tax=Timema californicum TaxID=61474 RepID=A0A7R9J630_TIMCA|nr:unnamed protein product [Timema californicum]
MKHLVSKVSPQITKDTNYRKALGAEVKLTIILRWPHLYVTCNDLAVRIQRVPPPTPIPPPRTQPIMLIAFLYQVAGNFADTS